MTPTQDRLTRSLRSLMDSGRRPPCGGPDYRLWTSEDADDRARAAARCEPCPIRSICAEVAEQGNELYVWAGVDYGAVPRKRGKKR